MASPAHLLLLCPLPPLPGGRAEARRGARRCCLGHLLLPPLATSCFLLGLPSDAPDDATRLPDRPSLPPELSPSSVSLSLSCRAQPSPPTLFAVATGHPSPRRCLQKNRRAFFFVSTNPCDAGSLGAPSPTSSSSSGHRDRRRPPVVTSPSPSSMRLQLQPP